MHTRMRLRLTPTLLLMNQNPICPIEIQERKNKHEIRFISRRNLLKYWSPSKVLLLLPLVFRRANIRGFRCIGRIAFILVESG